MSNRKSIQFLAVLTMVGAILALVLSLYSFPPRIDHRLHTAIGEALALEALRLAGSGQKITIITRDTEAFPQPALSTVLDRLRKEVRHAGRPDPAVQFVQADPLRPAQVPPGDLLELLRRSPAGSVIVSLLGPPTLRAEMRVNPAAVKAKIVAFCPLENDTSANLNELFAPGLLQAAVVQRHNPQTETGKPAKGARAFEQLYRVVKAGEVSSAPAGPP